MSLGLKASADGLSIDLLLGATVLATFSTTGIDAGTLLASEAEAQGLTNLKKLITPDTLAKAFKGANQSLGDSGYQKLPGGVIIQWGVFTNGQTTLIFPIAFPTACRAVAQMQTGQSSSAVTRIAFNGALSAASVGITGTSASGVPSTWIAIGN